MGGVLVGLNPRRCVDAFNAIGAQKAAVYVKEARTEDLFLGIETGRMTTAEFCREMRRICNRCFSDEDVCAAWNALLEPVTPAKRETLLSFKARGYRLFILSNTNEIHWRYASQTLIPSRDKVITDYFEYAFLSYEMRERKPSAGIYKQVLERAGILPEETMFVDDNGENIRVASMLGFRTFHEKESHHWVELLSERL